MQSIFSGMGNISFRNLKTVIKTKGTTLKEVAEKCGVAPTVISGICNGINIPKTDRLAKICSVLGVYPSEIVVFEGVEIKDYYFKDRVKEPLPPEPKGDVTYKPLYIFLNEYLEKYNEGKENSEKQSINYIFDRIDPPRRIKGISGPDAESTKKGLIAIHGEEHVSKNLPHTDYSKGLPAATRTKLRNDRPLNLAVIYEICKKLGCTIDYVLSYK